MAGIKEKNLPVAESLGNGDKIRIVTAAGNSKQIDAGAIGGGGFVSLNEDENGYLDKTWKEIKDGYEVGVSFILIETLQNGDDYYISGYSVAGVAYVSSDGEPYQLLINNEFYKTNTETGYPRKEGIS